MAKLGSRLTARWNNEVAVALSAPYFVLVREMRDAYNHRLRLVQSARQQGIKSTARIFQTTVCTMRKWLRRYQQQGPRGLIELSRAPHHQPGKTPAEVEQQVVALRQRLFTFGALRLIREFDLPPSHRALERIWRQHGLLKKRQRKYQRKQDLAHIKATFRIGSRGCHRQVLTISAAGRTFPPQIEDITCHGCSSLGLLT
ncbi:MAG: helix-turn-helix domain-containing protein [Terriglobales bacterium]